MEKISFYKMSGAGNDFIVIDKNFNPDFVLDKNSIQNLCDRRNGIGADGVITVANSDTYNFNMNYYNADGSTGSLCGNGARCAIKFASLTGRLRHGKAEFLSNGFTYSGEILSEDKIKFNFNSPGKLKYNFKIKAFNQLINACFVDTGSPHVVIKKNDVLKDPKKPNSSYENLDVLPVYELGREIRYNPDFSPGGTNVNFVDVKDGKVFIRTYERGVENETLACGTGSAAAAIIVHEIDKLNPPISLITRGGDELMVDFNIQDQKINNLSLTGPAKVTFTGEFLLNKFN